MNTNNTISNPTPVRRTGTARPLPLRHLAADPTASTPSQFGDALVAYGPWAVAKGDGGQPGVLSVVAIRATTQSAPQRWLHRLGKTTDGTWAEVSEFLLGEGVLLIVESDGPHVTRVAAYEFDGHVWSFCGDVADELKGRATARISAFDGGTLVYAPDGEAVLEVYAYKGGKTQQIIRYDVDRDIHALALDPSARRLVWATAAGRVMLCDSIGEVACLRPSSPVTSFGTDVTFTGAEVVVSSTEGAHVFSRTLGHWQETERLRVRRCANQEMHEMIGNDHLLVLRCAESAVLLVFIRGGDGSWTRRASIANHDANELSMGLAGKSVFVGVPGASGHPGAVTEFGLAE